MRSFFAGLVGALLVAATQVAAAPPLVSPSWLASRLDTPDVVVLDIRNDIDGGGVEAYRQAHIPGAVHSSYTADGWRVARDGVPGMLPPIQDLEALVGGLGIRPDDHVVIVHAGTGASDFGSAARVFWTFEQLGHEAVSILDGGMRAWSAADLPAETGAVTPSPVAYRADPPAEPLLGAAEVAARLEREATLVDARPEAQFDGAEKHPAAARAGHVPGAEHFDQAQWFDAQTGARRDPAEVADALPPALREGDQEVVSYCNTGHWAATNWFMLSQVLGRDNVSLYDGSMTEWSQDPSRPVATAVE